MKKVYLLLFFTLLLLCPLKRVDAQCPGGYTQSQLNWDFLDFLPSTGTAYTSWYASSSFPYTQNFAMGTRRVTFTMGSTSNFTLDGENAINTAHTGSFATAGDDVEFTTTTNSNRTITIDFDADVANLRFSMFDLDNNQRVTITGMNSLGIPQIVTITRVSGTGITLGGLPVSPTATGPNSNYADNNTNGSINVSFAGPVDNVVITLGNAAGDIWLSDLSACVTGAFVNDWRNISRPFTGMPAYIITVVDKRFLMVDPATGNAKDIYTDPTTVTDNLNGVCYDPVNRRIYYTYSLTGDGDTVKAIYRYDINTETKSTLIGDVNSIGMQTYSKGLESGAASFYNGALYFGVEGNNSTQRGREHTVWRLDFNASNLPYRSTQVYSVKSDSVDGSSNYYLKHDWSDIGVTNNGMLYDFDGATARTSPTVISDSMFNHFDMMTGQRVSYLPAGPGYRNAKQLAIDWDENVYSTGDSVSVLSGAANTTGFIVPYNYDGTVNAAGLRYISVNGVRPQGSWGDGGEAFRPYCDFGDAPASYDPDPWSPAVNERDTAIRIGATFDREWNKTSSALANADGSDEDGISTVPIFNPSYGNYAALVRVYNNTGTTARLIAWLDYNANGVFDAGEACQAQALVASTPALQTRILYWPSTPTPLTPGSFTYLRVRLVRSASGMANANATGYYDNGETEDYRVVVDNYPLAVNLLEFNAVKAGTSKSKLNWTVEEDANLVAYEVQRSGNGRDWDLFEMVAAGTTNDTRSYELIDSRPLMGTNYYRLAYKSGNGQIKYSEVRQVRFDEISNMVSIMPNPATQQFTVSVYSYDFSQPVEIAITDLAGQILSQQNFKAARGNNQYTIQIPPSWPVGMYLLQVMKGADRTIKKLMIKR